MPTIFGINIVLFTDAEVSFGASSILSDENMRRVYIEYYVSWIFLFFLMGVGHDFLRLPDRRVSLEQFQKISYSPRFYLLITISTMVLLCVDLLMFESWPGVSGFLGDKSSSEESKGAFIIEKMKNSIPLVGYLIRFLPYLAVALLFERYLRERKGLLFWLLIFFFLLYSALTLIKSFLLNAVIVCIIVFLLNTRKVNLRFFQGCDYNHYECFFHSLRPAHGR